MERGGSEHGASAAAGEGRGSERVGRRAGDRVAVRGVGALVRWLFPVRCAGCALPDADGICEGCLAAAAPAEPAEPPPELVAWFAPYSYEGAVAEAVTRVKYRNDRASVSALARAVADRLPTGVTIGVVSWVPTSRDHHRVRGFDHAELLARAVAREVDLPAERVLERADEVVQTGRRGAERRRGPAFVARRAPASVLLVDDVATTGTTLANAARALRREGSKWVMGATVARTPLKAWCGGSE